MDISKVHVYRMNEYEWYASKWDKETTNNWYLEEYGLDEEDNPLLEIEEMDNTKQGTWCETDNEEDIKRLGSNKSVGGIEKGETEFGDLKSYGGNVYKYTSFKDVLERGGDFEKPYCISCTEI